MQTRHHKNDKSATTEHSRLHQQHSPADLSEVDEGSHRTKRRRVSRACDQCRHGKLRCDGSSPRCSKCLETNKACSYGTAAKRRGLKTGYVRSLECLWGLVFLRIQGSEAAVESLLARTSTQDFRLRDHLGDGASGAESLLASWKASKIPERIHRLLAATEDSEDETNSIPEATAQRVEDHHPTISWNLPEQISHFSKDPVYYADKEPAEVSQTARSDNGMQTTIGNNNTSAVRGQSTLPHPLELPHGSRRLLDRYFAYTHSWLPIVERHVVFRTLYSYPKAGTSITRQSPDSGEHAVLWAMLACASAETPQTEAVPAHPARSNSTSELMYTNARSLIPWENEDGFSLSHVRALTILALYRWTTHDYKASWLAVSHAISIAFAIDLDQLATAGQYQRHPAERVWLGCFVMESLLAMRIGREPYLRPRDVEPFLPIDESGLEEWEPWRACYSNSSGLHYQDADQNPPTHALSTFNQLIRLLCIVNNHLRPSPSTSRMEQIALLQAWTEGLPKHCMQVDLKSSRENQAPILSPNIINLHLVYLSLALQLSMDPASSQERPSSLQIELQTLSDFADLINQVCNSDGSQALPPSLEILANAASDAQNPQIQSRETTLRQLQQDLTRLGLSSSISNGREAVSTVQTGNNASARDLAHCTGSSRIQYQEDAMNNANATSLLSPLDAPHNSHQLMLPQQLAQQTGTNDDANLRLQQQENAAAAHATDFLSADFLPTMTNGESFLDYFELFDEIEMFVLIISR
jgi:Fungal specific transcription factor domain/Fungal Zn(2)-Cys(6) binuclear cluster domain